MQEDNVEILVVSFDEYADIWPAFTDVLKKNWSDCPFKVRIISNEKYCKSFDTIKTGREINWSTRLLNALQHVQKDYVILLLEDYLIGEKVNSEYIKRIVKTAIKLNSNYFRFTNFPKSKLVESDKEYVHLFKDEEYAINLQAAIWKVSYLKESLLKYPGNAWQFEIGLLSETINASHTPLEGCYTMIQDPLSIMNGVLKGKWFPKTIKYFKRQGIDIKTRDRGTLNIFQVVKYESIQILKNAISSKTRKRMKKIARKFGFEFMSEY